LCAAQPFDAPERQSARMSKITNDGLTRPRIGCFIAVPMWHHWASKGTAKVFKPIIFTRQCGNAFQARWECLLSYVARFLGRKNFVNRFTFVKVTPKHQLSCYF